MKNLWCELEILARLPGKEKGRAIYEHVRGLSPQTLRISTGISSILSCSPMHRCTDVYQHQMADKDSPFPY